MKEQLENTMKILMQRIETGSDGANRANFASGIETMQLAQAVLNLAHAQVMLANIK